MLTLAPGSHTMRLSTILRPPTRSIRTTISLPCVVCPAYQRTGPYSAPNIFLGETQTALALKVGQIMMVPSASPQKLSIFLATFLQLPSVFALVPLIICPWKCNQCAVRIPATGALPSHLSLRGNSHAITFVIGDDPYLRQAFFLILVEGWTLGGS